MAQTPLTKELVDDPSLWRLSLLIGDEGIDVLAHRVVGEAPLVWSRIGFDPAAATPAAIEEAVYANPLLLAPFGKVDIVVRTRRALVVPAAVAAHSDAVEALVTLFPPGDGKFTSFTSPVDSRNSVVFLLDKGVANFLARTYDASAPRHAVLGLCGEGGECQECRCRQPGDVSGK